MRGGSLEARGGEHGSTPLTMTPSTTQLRSSPIKPSSTGCEGDGDALAAQSVDKGDASPDCGLLEPARSDEPRGRSQRAVTRCEAVVSGRRPYGHPAHGTEIAPYACGVRTELGGSRPGFHPFPVLKPRIREEMADSCQITRSRANTIGPCVSLFPQAGVRSSRGSLCSREHSRLTGRPLARRHLGMGSSLFARGVRSHLALAFYHAGELSLPCLILPLPRLLIGRGWHSRASSHGVSKRLQQALARPLPTWWGGSSPAPRKRPGRRLRRPSTAAEDSSSPPAISARAATFPSHRDRARLRPFRFFDRSDAAGSEMHDRGAGESTVLWLKLATNAGTCARNATTSASSWSIMAFVFSKLRATGGDATMPRALDGPSAPQALERAAEPLSCVEMRC